jgi:hypothetical protein
MNAKSVSLLALSIAVGGVVSVAQAVVPPAELSGNVFHSTPPSSSVFVQNNQDMNGGNYSGNTWPTSGDSFVTDGNLDTLWLGGKATHTNLSLTAANATWDGTWTGPGPQLTPNPGGFGAIQTIRIWAPTSLNGWTASPNPQQVRIDYTTSNSNLWMGNGFNAAAYMIGDLRDPNNIQGDGQAINGGYQYPAQIWPDHATITAVNGIAVTPDAEGYVSLAGAYQGGYLDTSNRDEQYVDLSVAIPAGAFSVAFEFGANTTGASGISITDIQANNVAVVPEPASLSLLGLSAGALVIRRRRNA